MNLNEAPKRGKLKQFAKEHQDTSINARTS